MKLSSKRLDIIPLISSDIGFLAEDVTMLEASLDLTYKGELLEGHLLDVIKGQHQKIQSDSKNYLWHTFWLFVLKDDKAIIGSACFKGLPDIYGNVEIGYGISEDYQNKGYTTEAVSSLYKWALKQVGVKNVIAETEKDNIQSQRVLEKCGFKVYKETDKCLWWRV